jgi:pilus assembly protein CpaB
MTSIRPLTVTLAAVAIVFGLVTAYLAKRMLEPKPPVAAERPVRKTVTVVVAQTNLTEYSRIGDRDVAALEVPVEDVPPGSMQTKARAVGRLVKTLILAGFPVRATDLYEPGMVPKMADQIPAGYRAVTLQVGDAIASNGAIQPGSLVDVSLTFDSDHPQVEGMATMSLMRQLMVLTPSPVNANRDQAVVVSPQRLTALTVAATPEQANKLILAQRYGTVNVTLCSSKETGALALAEGPRNLINKYALLGLPPVPTPESPIHRVVEIYRATDVRQVVFNEAGQLLSTEAAVTSTAGESAQPIQGTPRRLNAEEEWARRCPSCGYHPPVPFKKPAPGAASPSQPPAGSGQPDATGGSQPTLAPGPVQAAPGPAAPGPAAPAQPTPVQPKSILF